MLGCANKEPPAGAECVAFKKIALSERSQELIDVEDLRQVVDHNDAWIARCQRGGLVLTR